MSNFCTLIRETLSLFQGTSQDIDFSVNICLMLLRVKGKQLKGFWGIYLSGTMDYVVEFKPSAQLAMGGFVDEDSKSCHDSKRTTSVLSPMVCQKTTYYYKL